MSKRKFFSGNSIRQAVLAAASHFDVSPDELAYREVDKKHGFLKLRKRVIIEVDADDPRSTPVEIPATERNPDEPARRGQSLPRGQGHDDAAEEMGEPPGTQPRGHRPSADEDEAEEAEAVEEAAGGAEEEEEEERSPGGRGRGREGRTGEARGEGGRGRDRAAGRESGAAADEESGEKGRGRGRRGAAESSRQPEEKDERDRGRGRRGAGRDEDEERQPAPRQKEEEGDGRRGRKRGRGRGGRGGDEMVEVSEARRGGERRREARGALADACRTGLDRILEVAGLDVEYKVFEGDDRFDVELSGAHEELLVAEDGDLLRAIEHLLPRAMRGVAGESMLVRVNCGDFHEIHEERLRSMAQDVAAEVRRNGRPSRLEPMSPADRRIVHVTLADEPGVSSASDGTGHYKQIVVRPI